MNIRLYTTLYKLQCSKRSELYTPIPVSHPVSVAAGALGGEAGANTRLRGCLGSARGSGEVQHWRIVVAKHSLASCLPLL